MTARVPSWIRKPATLLLLGTLGFCGRVQAQERTDSLQAKPLITAIDTTVKVTDTTAADTVKQKWLSRMIDKYEDKFSSKGKKRLLTLSFNDVRANLKWGKTDASPTVGFDLLRMRYFYGTNIGRTINGARYEVGGFSQGHTWKSDENDRYTQIYARAMFNIKSAPGTRNPMRRLFVEAGVFRHPNFYPETPSHDRAAYAYATYEQGIPKVRLFGPFDNDKTIMLSSYVQHNYGPNLERNITSFGLRANLLKPFNGAVMKIITVNGRVGPSFTLDSREGFKFGFELIRSFRKFKQSSSNSTKTALSTNVTSQSQTTP